MTNLRGTSALLALTILMAGCSRTDNEPGPGGVTVSEAKALDDAAALDRDGPATGAEDGVPSGSGADQPVDRSRAPG